MKIYKYYLLLILGSILCSPNLWAQQIITLDAPESGNQTHNACELVNLLPGYTYTPTPSTLMHAYISDDCLIEPCITEDLHNYWQYNFFDHDLDISKEVGAIEGELTVDPNGAAAYNIPLLMPPATNGMSPQLSLVYNTNLGNDLLGSGWALQGVSAISRVGKNLFQDGKTTGVQLTSSDQFALNNQRMKNLSSNIYGMVNEDFSIITSYGTHGSGPSWFEVEAKSGIKMEYGKTAGSKFLTPDGSEIICWKLNRIIDQNGNYVDYQYKEEAEQHVLDKILFTGNQNAGLIPYNEVNFTYGTKVDANTKYIAGVPVHNAVLLKKIEILAEGQSFKKYSMTYGYDDSNFFPNSVNTHLNSILETGADGSQKNETIFDYGHEMLHQTCPNSVADFCHTADIFDNPVGLLNLQAEFRSADFNGDGFTDFIAFTYNTNQGFKDYEHWEMFINDGDETYSRIVSNGVLPNNFTIHDEDLQIDPNNTSTLLLRNSGVEVIDVNGDGLEDVIMSNSYQGQTNYTPYISTGSNLVADNSAKLTVDLDYTYFTLGDFNGDGKIDAFAYDPILNLAKIHFFSINGGMTELKSIDPSNAIYNSRIIPIDMEGDGTTELLYWKNYSHLRVMKFNISEGFQSNGTLGSWNFDIDILDPDLTLQPDVLLQVGDFNGDRKTDLLTHSGGLGWLVWYNNGLTLSTYNTGLLPDLLTPNNTYRKQYSRDINGDGFSDVVEVDDWQVNLYLSYGNGFVKKVFYNVPTNGNNADTRIDFVDHDGDGYKDFFYRNNSGNNFINLLKPAGHPHLEHLVDGYGRAWAIEHQPLTNSAIYDKGNQANYPITDIQIPFYVVSTTSTFNPLGDNTHTTAYSYEGLKVHRRGKGFLGFDKIFSSNTNDGRKQTQEFAVDLDFFSPYLKRNSQYLLNGDLVAESVFTYEFDDLGGQIINGIYYPSQFFKKLVAQSQTNGISGAMKSTTITYDQYGNETQRIDDLDGGLETTTQTFSWSNSGSTYPSKKTSATTTIVRSGKAAYSRTVDYNYSSVGVLWRIQSDIGTNKMKTTLFSDINSFGLPEKTTISAAGISSKNSTITYDSRGRYIVGQTNYLNQQTQYTISPLWGSQLSMTDFTGRTETSEYDGFGNLILQTNAFGITTTSQINWVSGNPDATLQDNYSADDILFERVRSKAGEPNTTIGFNRQGMPRVVKTNGHFQNILVVKSYNQKGELVARTNPFFENNPSGLVTTTSYDDYGRMLTNSDGNRTSNYSFSVQGTNVKTTVNTTGEPSKYIVRDASEKTTEANDAGGNIEYSYYSNGQMESTTLNGVLVATANYDLIGNQILISDPNAGITTFDYDNAKNLKTQQDANGNVYSFNYDVMDRLLSKSGPNGDYIYEYYSTGNGLNQVSQITAPNGITKKFFYDNNERLERIEEFIDGTAYNTHFEYDGLGRNIRKEFPSGYAIQNHYTSNGYLQAVTNDDGTITIWSADSQDALGIYNQYTSGNNIQTSVTIDDYGRPEMITAGTIQNLILDWNDQNGNLESRQDLIKGRSENFGYDGQNRINFYEVQGNTPNFTQYDNIGNIISKTSVGNYNYDASRWNAVTQVSNDQALISYTPQDITFNSFHKPSTINEGTFDLNYTYGVDEKRKVAEFLDNSSVTTKRVYVEGYEKSTSAGIDTEVHYIHGGSGLAALYVIEDGIPSYYYTYTDHLGSIVTLTDDLGTVVHEQNYDPWGRKRNAETWAYTNVVDAPSWLWRGYTGHEYLNDFQLINMNGRMYDPELGRMLSPDNYVADATTSQHYNRYTYANNNPMKYIDPDGEFVVALIIGTVVGAYVGGVITASAGGPANWNPFGGKDGSWKGTDWWKGAAIGGVIGAGIAVAGVALAGNVAANSVSWNIATYATISGNINILSATLQGRDLGEIAISGLIGLASGAIGAGIGSFASNRAIAEFSAKSHVIATSISPALNGFGDRFSLSLYRQENFGRAMFNGAKGLAEGVYLGWLWNQQISGIVAAQALTSIPGAGFTIGIAHFHASYYLYVKGLTLANTTITLMGSLARGIGLAAWTVAVWPRHYGTVDEDKKHNSIAYRFYRDYLVGNGYPHPF